jgi:small conductance mechanosensitive channel
MSAPITNLLDQPCQQTETLCRSVYRSTGNAWLANSADWLIARPAQILLIIVVAIVVRLIAHRAIARLTASTASGTVPAVLRPLRDRAAGRIRDTSPLLSERRRQRAETIGSVLRSLTSAVVFAVALILILGELGLNLAPLIAGAGVVGVAIGFGAQNLVKDFLSGMFMILEDQYGVGDVIDAGEASGTVESVGLRSTRLRDVNGTVWYIRNGEIARVGNMSQGWARAVLDVPVSYQSDLSRARSAIKAAADSVWHDPDFSALILEEPAVAGIETMGPEGLAVRLMVKTAPLEQWQVARELRERIKARFDADGITVPYPSGAVVIHTDGRGEPGPGGPGNLPAGASTPRGLPERDTSPDAT